MTALAQELTDGVGAPDLDTTQIGPLANPTQFERVSRYMEIGKKEARLVIGGEPADIGTGAVLPTIFADVPDDATIVHTPPFSPTAICLSRPHG